MDERRRVLIICAHFHGDRSSKFDRSLLQPSSGLQIASLIDPLRYDIKMHLEMWHGTLEPSKMPDADIVFLNGLAKDFDRQRQLSYFYRRKGAIVVAGGYLPTMFPAFASQYFDVTCVGGVDSVREVISDYERGTLKSIYKSPQTTLTDYRIRYDLLEQSGINLPAHLIEASRGCNFRCNFCVLPAEGARHTKYGVDRVMQSIHDAIDASPLLSMRRIFPVIWFIDNNFSNDLVYLRALCKRLRSDKRVSSWGALVTQDVMKNRAVVAEMARCGCSVLFTGLESLDIEFLRSHNKFQNLPRDTTIVQDIAFAQSQGIVVTYGYLFDPRMSTIAKMREQLDHIESIPSLLFPSFIAIVSPLLGTKLFWEAAAAGSLRPNLRLRDIDGQTIVYSNCRNSDAELTAFAWDIFRYPNKLVNRWRHLMNFLKRCWQLRRGSLLTHLVHYRAHFRIFRLAKARQAARTKTYIGGTEALDASYDSWPADISDTDKQRYFAPILVTDAEGRLVDWLAAAEPHNKSAPQPTSITVRA